MGGLDILVNSGEQQATCLTMCANNFEPYSEDCSDFRFSSEKFLSKIGLALLRDQHAEADSFLCMLKKTFDEEMGIFAMQALLSQILEPQTMATVVRLTSRKATRFM